MPGLMGPPGGPGDKGDAGLPGIPGAKVRSFLEIKKNLKASRVVSDLQWNVC